MAVTELTERPVAITAPMARKVLISQIKGKQIVQSAADGSSNLNTVTQVRYWWSGNPAISSLLYNDLELPASPFITVVE